MAKKISLFITHLEHTQYETIIHKCERTIAFFKKKNPIKILLVNGP